jgi:hypothetical protein
MSEQKKINIDMNLFNFSNKTRKKKPGEKKDGIKVKQPAKKNDSIKKKSILKMIRQHQEDRYSKLLNEKSKPLSKPSEESSGFNKDFEEAQKFMQNLTEKTKVNTDNKNKSLKNYHTNTNSLLYHPLVDTFSNTLPIQEVTNSILQGTIAPSTIALNPNFPKNSNPIPQYGCLKNGQLPTYRDYMNKTRKVMPTIAQVGGTTIAQVGGTTIPQVGGTKIPQVGGTTIAQVGGTKIPQPAIQEKKMNDIRNDIIEKKLKDSMNRVNEMKNVAVKLQEIRNNNKPKKLKRKKTIRRTYKVGKSKIHPKVSVLVSNKTIRNNISTKSQLLKQTPIEDVKKHLINQGLIKIGTIAPNDVLRKMYESSVLMCGELNNHNPDNLLHNFMNGPK